MFVRLFTSVHCGDVVAQVAVYGDEVPVTVQVYQLVVVLTGRAFTKVGLVSGLDVMVNTIESTFRGSVVFSVYAGVPKVYLPMVAVAAFALEVGGVTLPVMAVPANDMVATAAMAVTQNARPNISPVPICCGGGLATSHCRQARRGALRPREGAG